MSRLMYVSLTDEHVTPYGACDLSKPVDDAAPWRPARPWPQGHEAVPGEPPIGLRSLGLTTSRCDGFAGVLPGGGGMTMSNRFPRASARTWPIGALRARRTLSEGLSAAARRIERTLDRSTPPRCRASDTGMKVAGVTNVEGVTRG